MLVKINLIISVDLPTCQVGSYLDHLDTGIHQRHNESDAPTDHWMHHSRVPKPHLCQKPDEKIESTNPCWIPIVIGSFTYLSRPYPDF